MRQDIFTYLNVLAYFSRMKRSETMQTSDFFHASYGIVFKRLRFNPSPQVYCQNVLRVRLNVFVFPFETFFKSPHFRRRFRSLGCRKAKKEPKSVRFQPETIKCDCGPKEVK